MQCSVNLWARWTVALALGLAACGGEGAQQQTAPEAAAGHGSPGSAGSPQAGAAVVAGAGAGAGAGAAAASSSTAGAGGAAPSAGAGAAGPSAGAGGVGAAGGGAPMAGGPAAGGPSTPAGPGDKLTARIVARQVPPEGQEHVCVVVALDNPEPVWVHRLDAVLSGGSHHLIVDRRPADAEVIEEPEVCSPTMGGEATRLLIAQQVETSVELPDRVAFKLDPRQRVFLQLHYFNVSDKPQDISGTVELSLVDPAAGEPIEAQTLFTGATQITIPARAMIETSAFFVPQAGTGVRRVFGLTSHTHRLGVRAAIERVPTMDAPAAEPLHESLNWAEPPLTMFDPPLSFDGSDGLRLTCRYVNDTDQTVHFGVEAQDEMCFMWLYFFDAP